MSLSWGNGRYFHDITTVSGPIESFYGDDGALLEPKVRALSRTYAPIVAGTPTATRFDRATGAFRLRYESAACDGLPTELFLNEAWTYDEHCGFNISVFNASLLLPRVAGSNTLQVRRVALRAILFRGARM